MGRLLALSAAYGFVTALRSLLDDRMRRLENEHELPALRRPDRAG